MRPICIGSALVKLLELPFLPPLMIYLSSKMKKQQIGFVPSMEVNVNIFRAISEIQYLNALHGHCFALFLDLRQAYNSVPHHLLFRKLAEKQALPPLHIQFLKALYSRFTIRIGKYRVRPNKGVAQGSILSPALFDIFIEDLIGHLQTLCPRINQILAFADDLLIICPDLDTLKRVIFEVEFWILTNGMSLNKSKSGIMRMTKRHGRDSTSLIEVSGIPVVKCYKYLGTLFTPKLYLQSAAVPFLEKLRSIKNFLQPILRRADIKTRWYLWRLFVEPKLRACAILFCHEPSQTTRKWFIQKLKGSMKQFLGIRQKAHDIWCNWLFRSSDEELRMEKYFDAAAAKWASRLGEQLYLCSRASPLHSHNFTKYVSPKLIELINLFTAMCPLCSRARLFPNHISCHGLQGIAIKNIQDEIDETIFVTKARKEEITVITEKVANFYLEKLRGLIRTIKSRNFHDDLVHK